MLLLRSSIFFLCVSIITGCQRNEELLTNEAVYDHVCRQIIDDVSTYPERVEIRETSIYIKTIPDDKASSEIDKDWFELFNKYRNNGESFHNVLVGYKLLENGISKQWICVFNGMPSVGMYVSAFNDGMRDYNASDEYYFFKSGASHLDIFRVINRSDFSTLDRLGFWIASLI